MICRYTFAVLSKIGFPTSLEFEAKNHKFKFLKINGKLSKIVVEIRGTKLPFNPTITSGPYGATPHVKIPADAGFDFLQFELRAIKGALYLWGIDDIDTNGPELEWIPETEEEKEQTKIYSLSTKIEDSEEVREDAPLDLLIRTIVSRRLFLEYELPLEFYRRASEDLGKGRYIEAFYGFYFVLEFLFGHGQFKKGILLSHYGNEEKVKEAIQTAISEPHSEVLGDARFREKYRSTYIGKSKEEILEHIIDRRGFLHHQSSSRKRNWSPHNDQEFAVDAFFLQMMSYKIIADFCIDKLFDENEFEGFKQIKVRTDDGRIVNWTPMKD